MIRRTQDVDELAGRRSGEDFLPVSEQRDCSGATDRFEEPDPELVAKRVERLPVAAVAVRGQFALLGETLQRLLDRVIGDPTLNTRDRLLSLARSMGSTGPGS